MATRGFAGWAAALTWGVCLAALAAAQCGGPPASDGDGDGDSDVDGDVDVDVDVDSDADTDSDADGDGDAEVEPENVRQVLLLIFDPVIESADGHRLTELMLWRDPVELAEQCAAWWLATSDGRFGYRVVDTIVVDGIPIKEDGFSYTEESYLAVLTDPSSAHAPDFADYATILSTYLVCDRVNSGEVDELWMFGGPWFGFYESRLAGPGAFPYNSPPLSGTSCEQLLPIMGFNYERSVNEMVHDFGHRTEATMTFLYGGWAQDRLLTPWDRFGLVASLSPSLGFSGCGSIHHSPTATFDYSYGEPGPVQSMCDDFSSYPDLRPAEEALATISCDPWGCSELGYYEWWFRHLPQAPGQDAEGRLNDWFLYAMDPSQALAAAPSDGSCLTYGSEALCSPHANRCTWHGCASRCLPNETDATEVCTCAPRTSIPDCDALAPTCAWYSCVEFCLPTGTPVDLVCGY